MPYATINGAELFYEESGSQDGESSPIIFHHGYTSSHDCWHGVVPRLSGQYHCVVMDGRGAGDSNNAPGPCTLDQYAADVVGLADHLGFGFFNYVGLSMGGAVGYELPCVTWSGSAAWFSLRPPPPMASKSPRPCANGRSRSGGTRTRRRSSASGRLPAGGLISTTSAAGSNASSAAARPTTSTRGSRW